jgi:hypothetical protein
LVLSVLGICLSVVSCGNPYLFSACIDGVGRGSVEFVSPDLSVGREFGNLYLAVAMYERSGI